MTAIGSPCDLVGRIRAVQDERQATPDGPQLVIGMVGRIQPWKGQDVFLRAFAAAFPDGDARAVVVGGPLFGEDAYMEELRRLAVELNIAERVQFTGHVDEPATQMEGFDILVHASVVPEPFGQVVVEGMALGLPVIATAAGGPEEVVTDGTDGLLYPPGDVRALAHLLRQLADDPAMRRQLGANAVGTAAAYSPSSIADQVERFYTKVIGSQHGR